MVCVLFLKMSFITIECGYMGSRSDHLLTFYPRHFTFGHIYFFGHFTFRHSHFFGYFTLFSTFYLWALPLFPTLYLWTFFLFGHFTLPSKLKALFVIKSQKVEMTKGKFSKKGIFPKVKCLKSVQS